MIINKPDVSRVVTGFYAGMAVFIFILGTVITYNLYLHAALTEVITTIIALVFVFAAIEAVILSILAAIYGTKYILTEQELIVTASRFIGGTRRIPLETIKSAERTLIPFGFRLLGASFYGGYYYFPTLRRTFMVITNFKDGVLIRTERENYIITPKDPESFVEIIEQTIR